MYNICILWDTHSKTVCMTEVLKTTLLIRSFILQFTPNRIFFLLLLDDWEIGVQSPERAHHFLFYIASTSTKGTGDSFPEVKWLGHEADQSPHSSSKVRNAWHYISICLYASMTWHLTQPRDFTFLILYHTETHHNTT